MTDQTSTTTPQWFAEMAGAYSIGAYHAFILHLNVRDYVKPGVMLKKYLTAAYQKKDIVVFYNRAEGMTFPIASMKEKAVAVLGLTQKEDDAFAAALRGVGADTQEDDGVDLPKSPEAAVPYLHTLLTQDKYKVAVIIDAAEFILPSADIATMGGGDKTTLLTIQNWGANFKIGEFSNTVVLTTGLLSDLHPNLRAASNKWMSIEIPIPDRDSREEYIKWYAEQSADIQFEDGFTVREFANLTAGLSLVHIEDIFLRATADGFLSREMVRDVKRQIVETEYDGIVEIIEPTFGFEAVGGMEYLKKWSLEEIIQPVRAGDFRDVPKGVLFVGPPGTGKTYFVSALAKELGFNAVALNLENILGGIVGTSERNLKKALSIAASLAPVLLFIDELDQSDVSSRGNGSGNPVAKNLFSMLLRFLGDPTNRGKVIFFGASNRPDLIDPAFMRFGRVDAIIPVLLPEEPERKMIIETQARRQEVEIEPKAADYLASTCTKYSGADLSAVVSKARKTARRAGADHITLESAVQAFQAIRPTTIASADRFTLMAVQACNDTTLLPPQYASLLEDRGKLTETIAELEDGGEKTETVSRKRRAF